MYCLESKISKQVLLTRKPYCVPRIDDADLIRKLNAVNTPATVSLNNQLRRPTTNGLMAFSQRLLSMGQTPFST